MKGKTQSERRINSFLKYESFLFFGRRKHSMAQASAHIIFGLTCHPFKMVCPNVRSHCWMAGGKKAEEMFSSGKCVIIISGQQIAPSRNDTFRVELNRDSFCTLFQNSPSILVLFRIIYSPFFEIYFLLGQILRFARKCMFFITFLSFSLSNRKVSLICNGKRV